MSNMRSEYWTRTRWKARLFCDNSSMKELDIGLRPKCYDGGREYDCIIHFNEYDLEPSTVVLCSECAIHLKRDCRKYGYRFQSKKRMSKQW